MYSSMYPYLNASDTTIDGRVATGTDTDRQQQVADAAVMVESLLQSPDKVHLPL